MDQHSLNQRLSSISTMWTLVRQANKGAVPEDAETAAMSALIERYHGAIYRYFLSAVKDPDAADDLFQEFALRFCRGAFRRADPNRGRFRDFLRTAAINLIKDYRKGRRLREQPLDSQFLEAADQPEETLASDREFLQSWRDELLARAWQTLAKAEHEGGQPFYSVLRFRSEHPEMNSSEMAERLSTELRLSTPLTDTAVRRILQRAREKFADLILADVAASLESQSVEDLEQELIDLGLLSYCRSALDRRRQT
ncbi:MAG: sigma-70 family RNA polymerase sigma factor [Planctomycetes bacterium]|nr:sigma-70 family RNA polymerase sigma factor [Planctomycetota bacterium]